jgi:hypothetical protein
MKLLPPHRHGRRRQRGFLVIAMLAIISIMLVYIAANLHVLAALKRDIRLVEQKQVLRLSKTFPVAPGATTNTAPVIPPAQTSAQ